MQFWMSSHIICSITCSHWIPLFDLVSPDFFLFLVSIVLAQGVSISCALKQLLPWSRGNLWSCRGMCVWNSSVWEIGKAWLYHVLEALAIQLSSKKKKKVPFISLPNKEERCVKLEWGQLLWLYSEDFWGLNSLWCRYFWVTWNEVCVWGRNSMEETSSL